MFIPLLTFGQDLHFSQFYSAPALLNPSATGDFNSVHRAFLQYRDQWRGIVNYQTFAMTYDYRTGIKKKKHNDFLGLGLVFLRDRAGDSRFDMSQINFGLAYHKELIPDHRFSFGFQGGMRQHAININNLKWGSQYNTITYDPTIASGETLMNQTVLVADFNAGTQWTYVPYKGFEANAGVAVHHLSQPHVSFFENANKKQYRKLVAHASSEIEIANTNTTYIPKLLVVTQGPSREIIAGSLVRYEFNQSSKYTTLKKESAIFLGTFYRFGEALILSTYYDYEGFGLGISYDLNISRLALGGRGALEISLKYIAPFVSKHYGKKPR